MMDDELWKTLWNFIFILHKKLLKNQSLNCKYFHLVIVQRNTTSTHLDLISCGKK